MRKKGILNLRQILALPKIPKVFVPANIERCQAHGISLYLCHNGVEEFSLFVAGGGDTLVEGVAQGHQLINAGNKAVLFWEGGEGNSTKRKLCAIKIRLSTLLYNFGFNLS